MGGFYYVKTADGVVECAKGIFRKGHHPVAGDRVRLNTRYQLSLLRCCRKNVFVRPPVANVDQFFIVASTCSRAQHAGH
ncbi:MAG: hypothetical protein ACLRRT_07425 [Ruthenibacterium lactatiformans]